MLHVFNSAIISFAILLTDAENGSANIGQQNRNKITATLGLVVHAAGKY